VGDFVGGEGTGNILVLQTLEAKVHSGATD
jgi:hypothetical protein